MCPVYVALELFQFLLSLRKDGVWGVYVLLEKNKGIKQKYRL